MRSNIAQWILYNIIVCFAVYWLSNVILWYPWSVNEKLGQTIMLTVNPILWGYASYLCIKKFPETNLLKGAFFNSVVFLAEAIISDMILFAGIQQAMDKLMHPTTLYGWGFVATVPFIIYILFKKPIKNHKKLLYKHDFKLPFITGVVSFILIAIVLIFNIRFGQ
ncbi:hypothetical protein [uncultured Draconibacterium sp.]|uniref:hypothetical protein n=1 Tax=uncultured Draconibacterium sp. TaxID=1573823 RepID=UPI0025E899A2|nr:hypothetical protein [uncultured Draconibacterium sp.]